MFFTGKKVLIIGGTGTIGVGLLKKIGAENPQVIRIFSRDEYKQFELQNDLRGTDLERSVRFLIGDVRDFDRVKRAMEDIDFVFHLAAMKHVPSCEYNPYEAVQTNIIGTHNVIQAAIECNVERVIFTSSDKAISPTNTYGASKLTGERLIAAAQYHKGPSNTIFSAVRFGNVMGSRGSVIPLFVKQILTKRRVTVTDSTMTRFMMSQDQATGLTIEAMKHSQGGEIMILKMPTVLLGDLAGAVIELTCAKYGIDPDTVTIEECGLRPGEKMYEELMTYEESETAFELENMFVVPSAFVKTNQYSGAKRAHTGTYSSEEGEVLSLEEVRKIITELI
ncbi:MAG TPA: SDR family NAD(P)-dependent oxidoreductase [Bacillota bacterium]|nr:SDR family NAD(P)-dependent oxidoreductase [Bacillota bacterium]